MTRCMEGMSERTCNPGTTDLLAELHRFNVLDSFVGQLAQLVASHTSQWRRKNL